MWIEQTPKDCVVPSCIVDAQLKDIRARDVKCICTSLESVERLVAGTLKRIHSDDEKPRRMPYIYYGWKMSPCQPERGSDAPPPLCLLVALRIAP